VFIFRKYISPGKRLGSKNGDIEMKVEISIDMMSSLNFSKIFLGL
jgi:hypothetical protein